MSVEPVQAKSPWSHIAMPAFREWPGGVILNGDVIACLRAIPAGSVQMGATSPPYWGALRDYGTNPIAWGGDPSCDHQWDRIWTPNQNSGGGASPKQITNRGSFSSESYRDGGPLPRKPSGPRGRHSGMCSLCGSWKGELGSEPLHCCADAMNGGPLCSVCYCCHLRTIFREIWRVLRKDGIFWLNLGDAYSSGGRATRAKDRKNEAREVDHRPLTPASLKQKDLAGIPWRVALSLQSDGWYLRNDAIWEKPNCQCESVQDRLTRSHEYVFLLSKSKTYYYDRFAILEPYAEVTLTQKGTEYRGKGLKDYAAASVQNPSDNKRRMIASLDKYEGRNHRTIFRINTAQYEEAHFATWPPQLVTPMVLAGSSEAGSCSACGKGWRRIVKKADAPAPLDYEGKWQGEDSQSSGRRLLANVRARRKSGQHHDIPFPVPETIGWEPACKCNAGEPEPSTILDPFGDPERPPK